MLDSHLGYSEILERDLNTFEQGEVLTESLKCILKPDKEKSKSAVHNTEKKVFNLNEEGNQQQRLRVRLPSERLSLVLPSMQERGTLGGGRCV